MSPALAVRLTICLLAALLVNLLLLLLLFSLVMVRVVNVLTCEGCRGSILPLVVVVQPIPFSLDFF